MKLDRTTYEIFLIDYLDGKLGAVEVSELLLFLEQNPDLKEEFDGIADVEMAADSGTTFNSSYLKKPVYDDVKSEFDHLLVAKLEGDLTQEQQHKLNTLFAQYPELKKAEKAFACTKLQPDFSVKFRKKSKLKVFVLQSYYRQVSVIAAALLLCGFVWFYMNDQLTGSVSQTAQTSTENLAGENSVAIKPADSFSTRISQPTHSIARVEKNKVQEKKVVVEIDKKAKAASLVVAFIQPRLNSITVEQQSIIIPDHIHGRITMPEGFAQVENEEYVDIKTWIIRKFRKQADLKNDEGLLAKINRATGADVVIEKDTTGKINRFEIAGIGLVSR